MAIIADKEIAKGVENRNKREKREAPSHPFLLADTPLIGREKELEKLQQCLCKVKKGWGKFVLVTGEAGIGKTLLVETFLNSIEPESVELLRCYFRYGEGIRPYGVFLKALTEYGGRKKERREEVPSIIEVFSEAEEYQTKRERNRSADYFRTAFISNMMRQNISYAFVEICRQQPLILILHDLHLAPRTVWQFIHYFSDNIKGHPILLIGTLRQDHRILDRSRMPSYVDVLKRMGMEDLYVRIRLSRFEENQTRHLLRSFFPKSDFDSTLIPDLHEYSGGNPFFLVSEIGHLIANGVIYQEDGIWFNKEYDFRKVGQIHNPIDKGVRYQIKQYLCALEEPKRQILAYASLLGPSFEYKLIAELMGMNRLQLLEILESFQAYPHILRYVNGRYRFNHPLVKEVIQRDLDEKTKAAMHLQIARAIESIGCGDKFEHIYLLAHHYSFTTDNSKAFCYLLRAGDLAVRNFAFYEARKFYLQAYDRKASFDELETTTEELHLLLQLAWLDRILGDWEHSLRCCQQALKRCDSTLEIRTENEILLQKGLTLLRLNRWQEALECFEKCLHSGENASCFDKAMAKYGIGNIYFELGNWNRARESFLESLNLAKEIGADYLIANLLNNLGAVENVTGNRIKAICYYSQGIPIYERMGNSLGLARIYNNIGITHAEEGDWERANKFYGKSLALSDKMGFVPLKITTFLNRAIALLKLRSYAEAREYNAKAQRLLRKVKDNLSLAEHYKIQGMIERETHNWKKAQRALTKARTIFQKYENRLGVAETEYEKGILNQQLGNLHAAQKCYERALHEYECLGLKEKVEEVKQQLRKT